MNRTIRTLLLAGACALAIVPCASAQTTTQEELMFHWGALHLGPDQALAVNIALTDHFGDPLSLPVELEIEDGNGKLLYRGAVTLDDGHAISFAVGPDIRALRSAIPAHVYAGVGPEIRLLLPCIKVLLPPGPNSPVDRLTPTLEVIDLTTGRVQSLANNPHAIIAVLSQ